MIQEDRDLLSELTSIVEEIKKQPAAVYGFMVGSVTMKILEHLPRAPLPEGVARIIPQVRGIPIRLCAYLPPYAIVPCTKNWMPLSNAWGSRSTSGTLGDPVS
jgi:hypothetical protein